MKRISLHICIGIALFAFSIIVPFSFTHAASIASDLVISEIQIGTEKSASDSFIEIYNPTNSPINLSESYRLYKQDSKGIESNITDFSATDLVTNPPIVPAFGYFLWANSDYAEIATKPDVATSATIEDDNGIALQKYSATEDDWFFADRVGWGGFSGTFFENRAYPDNIAIGKSIERNPGEVDSLKGNGNYTANNFVDFTLREIPEPQNSVSEIEIPEGKSLLTNILPVPDLGGDKIVLVDEKIVFDGSLSTDSDGEIIEYLWGFGDTTTALGKNVEHVYNVVGEYTVSLRVTDDDGGQTIGFVSVKIANPGTYSSEVFINEFLPTPGNTVDWDKDASADYYDEWIELVNNDKVDIDLSGWFLDDIANGGSDPYAIPDKTIILAGGVLVLYQKDTGLVLNDKGDNIRLISPVGTTVNTYSYALAGADKSSITDKSYSRAENKGMDAFTTTYTPSPGELNPVPPNQPPIAEAGKDIECSLGSPAKLDGSESTDVDGKITDYAWDFDDGKTGTGAVIDHTYEKEGTYIVKLTVTDDDGVTSTDTLKVVINIPPSYSPLLEQPMSPPEEVVSPTGDVIITEIMPDSGDVTTSSFENNILKISADSGSGGYIVLKNIDDKIINLRNWSINVGSGQFVVNYEYLLKPNLTTKFFSSETKLVLSGGMGSVKLFDSAKELTSNVDITSFPPKENTPYVLYGDKWQWGDNVQEAEEVRPLVMVPPVDNVVTIPVAPVAGVQKKIIAKTPAETVASKAKEETAEKSSAEEILSGVGKILTDVPGAEAADGSKQGKSGGTILNLLLILFALLFMVVAYVLLHPLQLYAKLVKFFSKNKQIKKQIRPIEDETTGNLLNDSEERKA